MRPAWFTAGASVASIISSMCFSVANTDCPHITFLIKVYHSFSSVHILSVYGPVDKIKVNVFKAQSPPAFLKGFKVLIALVAVPNFCCDKNYPLDRAFPKGVLPTPSSFHKSWRCLCFYSLPQKAQDTAFITSSPRLPTAQDQGKILTPPLRVVTSPKGLIIALHPA